MNESPETRASLLLEIRDPANRQAWQEFLAVYEPMIYRLLRRRGLQDSDARDLTQDVLIAVHRRIDQWRPSGRRGAFRSWLARIARNLTINLLVRERRHIRGVDDNEIRQLMDSLPDRAETASAVFDRAHRWQLVVRAADSVRGEFRDSTWQAFWQTAVEQQHVGDVAQRLGITVGAVYIARSRVMARLKEVVRGLGEDKLS